MQFQNEIGAMTPLGLWDPLNVLNGKDQKQFDRLRAQEIKHGRVGKNVSWNEMASILYLMIH
jgi:hypothetical protein